MDWLTRYTYDLLGRLKTVTVVERMDKILALNWNPPGSEVTTYTYDAVGNLDTVTLPNGVVSNYNYDDFNRLIDLTHYESAGGAVRASFVYTLSVDGRRTGVVETDNLERQTTILWTYDNAGRLTEEIYDSFDPALDFTARYTFDLVGNRTKKEVDDGRVDPIATFDADETVTYTYDKNDRLLVETKDIDGSTSSDRITTYQYSQSVGSEAAGGDGTELTRKIVKTSSSVTTNDTTYKYNLQGRLKEVVEQGVIKGDGSHLFS